MPAVRQNVNILLVNNDNVMCASAQEIGVFGADLVEAVNALGTLNCVRHYYEIEDRLEPCRSPLSLIGLESLLCNNELLRTASDPGLDTNIEAELSKVDVYSHAKFPRVAKKLAGSLAWSRGIPPNSDLTSHA